jgi:hypothetical protein
MRFKPAFILVALALPVALGGCSGTAAIAMAGISAVSFAATEKFPTDHVASWVTGEDCSALEAERTGQYCRTEAEVAAAEAAARPGAVPAVYCYRTIGEITCQSEPDPTAASRLVQ